MIQKISKTLERQEGLMQARYKEFNVQVLLHFCKKDVILKKHKHKQLQFGYTFYGKYHFMIDDSTLFYMGDCHSYILNSYINHEAIALTDYYALDVKYYGKVKNKMYLNYQFPNKEVDLQAFYLEGDEVNITISKISTNSEFKLNKGTNLIFTKNKCSINLDDNRSHIIPMEIYKIDASINTISQEYNNNEILIINLNSKI